MDRVANLARRWGGFVKDTVEKTGQSDRKVRRDAERGENLSKPVVSEPFKVVKTLQSVPHVSPRETTDEVQTLTEFV